MVSLGWGFCFVQIAVMDVPRVLNALDRGFLMIAPMARISFAAFALTVGIATSTAAVLPGVPARQDIFLRIIAAQSRKSRL